MYSFLAEIDDFLKKVGIKFDEFELKTNCFDEYFISTFVYLIYVKSNFDDGVFSNYYADNMHFLLKYIDNKLVLVVRTNDNKYEFEIGSEDGCYSETVIIYITAKFHALRNIKKFSEQLKIINRNILEGKIIDKRIDEYEKAKVFSEYIKNVLMAFINYYCDGGKNFYLVPIYNCYISFCQCMSSVHLSKLLNGEEKIIILPNERKFSIRRNGSCIELYEFINSNRRFIVGFSYIGNIYGVINRGMWRKRIFLNLIRYSMLGSDVSNYALSYHINSCDINILVIGEHKYRAYLLDTISKSNSINFCDVELVKFGDSGVCVKIFDIETYQFENVSLCPENIAFILKMSLNFWTGSRTKNSSNIPNKGLVRIKVLGGALYGANK